MPITAASVTKLDPVFPDAEVIAEIELLETVPAEFSMPRAMPRLFVPLAIIFLMTFALTETVPVAELEIPLTTVPPVFVAVPARRLLTVVLPIVLLEMV